MNKNRTIEELQAELAKTSKNLRMLRKKSSR